MTETDSHGTKQVPEKPRNIRTIIISAIVVFTVLNITLAGIILYRTLNKPAAEAPKYVNKTFLTQVEVLNACGKRGITDAIVNRLRANEVDVVQAKNYFSFDLEESLVICRTENREKAMSIAAVLGLPESRVVQLVNKNYFLDATILLGKDYSHLGSTEKGKH